MGKVASLSDSLGKKPEWKGAMVRTPMDPHDFNGFYFKDKVFGNEDNGSTPWLATCRPHSWRYGPHAWPLPGFGAFAQALDPAENLESYIVAIPITAIIKEGIAMRDVAAFLETETGSRVFGAEAKVMKLCKGSVLWIPYGFVAIPVAVLEEKDEEKKGASTKAPLATL
jgi:hypothetical protein